MLYFTLFKLEHLFPPSTNCDKINNLDNVKIFVKQLEKES